MAGRAADRGRRGGPRRIHLHRLAHDAAEELRAVQVRDTTGSLRTIRSQDVAEQLCTIKVRDITGEERTLKLRVSSGAPPRTAIEHKQATAHAILALHGCAWLLSGWDRLRLQPRAHQARWRAHAADDAPLHVAAHVRPSARPSRPS